MKAKAPEKIYVKITHPISDEYTEMIAFEDGDGIEYVRKDAFIEEVCDYINRHLALLDTENKDCMPKWLEKFKEAMKL